MENTNQGACGTAGCSIKLFAKQSDGKFSQILGTVGEVGRLRQFKVLTEITKGHYAIQKTWHDGKTATVYAWDGSRYVAR